MTDQSCVCIDSSMEPKAEDLQVELSDPQWLLITDLICRLNIL